MKDVLLLGDVDAIREFVFETSYLPQIRGGSKLLEECEEEIKKKTCEAFGPEKILYCAGGSFLLEVLAERAREFGETIERLYLEKTGVATVTVVFEEEPMTETILGPDLPDGWAERLVRTFRTHPGGDFGRRVSFLYSRLRTAKMEKRQAPFFETLPFGKRCEGCGKRLAEKKVFRYEPKDTERRWPEEIALCGVCLRRHGEGRSISEYQRVRGVYNTEFLNFIKDRIPDGSKTQAPDIDEMVKSARRHQYLAFLYADGNNIGMLLQRAQNKKDYQKISQILKEGTKAALFGALIEVCESALLRKEDYWPFEIVNIGGDDITILLQAGYAWEVAIKFLCGFEKEMETRIRESFGSWPERWPKITASCGIIMADPKYPMYYFEKLARASLAEAKKLAKKNKENPQSAIHFLWLPNPILSESIEPLLTYYEKDRWSLTSRPYTLEQAEKIHCMVQECAKLPRHLRYQWGEALGKGPVVSRLEIGYGIVRRKEKKKEVEWLQKVRNILSGAAISTWDPWRIDTREGKSHTPLLDVLELTELYTTRPGFCEKED